MKKLLIFLSLISIVATPSYPIKRKAQTTLKYPGKKQKVYNSNEIEALLRLPVPEEILIEILNYTANLQSTTDLCQTCKVFHEIMVEKILPAKYASMLLETAASGNVNAFSHLFLNNEISIKGYTTPEQKLEGIRDEAGNTVLHLACSFKRTPIINIILENCLKLIENYGKLYLAIESGDLPLLEQVLNSRVNPNGLVNKEGQTPYDIFSNQPKPPHKNLFPDFMLCLLNHSTTLHHLFKIRQTIFNTKNISQIFDLLISQGADINIQDQNGNTPLHTALLEGGIYEAVNMLLKNGANPNIINKAGQTALDLAKDLATDNAKVISLLIQNEAKSAFELSDTENKK